MATRGQTRQHKTRFLDAFRVLGNVSAACEETGVARGMVYRWRDGDAEFAAAFAEAEIEATEHMEREAHRRAVVGTDKPVYQGGQLVGYVRDYSDTLLIFLLKARAPAKYRERFDHTLAGPNGAPVVVTLDLGDRKPGELDAGDANG